MPYQDLEFTEKFQAMAFLAFVDSHIQNNNIDGMRNTISNKMLSTPVIERLKDSKWLSIDSKQILNISSHQTESTDINQQTLDTLEDELCQFFEYIDPQNRTTPKRKIKDVLPEFFQTFVTVAYQNSMGVDEKDQNQHMPYERSLKAVLHGTVIMGYSGTTLLVVFTLAGLIADRLYDTLDTAAQQTLSAGDMYLVTLAAVLIATVCLYKMFNYIKTHEDEIMAGINQQYFTPDLEGSLGKALEQKIHIMEGSPDKATRNTFLQCYGRDRNVKDPEVDPTETVENTPVVLA